MRLLHKVPYSQAEIESYRQLVFKNLIQGMNALLEALDLMDFTVSSTNIPYIEMIRDAGNVCDGEPFPYTLYEALRSLWKDPSVKAVWKRQNEAALPEKFVMFQSIPPYLSQLTASTLVCLISFPRLIVYSCPTTSRQNRIFFTFGNGLSVSQKRPSSWTILKYRHL